jgi:prolyl-tRNA synthetase
MRVSNLFMPTMREIPADAEVVSHQLMLRAGLIRKLASGVYALLPLGFRVVRKIENIIREEMEAAGAQELLMPALLPSESLQASGRWDLFGPEMFRLKDRNNRDFCLGPTHEEAFADTVKNGARSYKDLPLMLYQIQTKYRDERRPRFGVIRSREFIMKDAYSFDRDELGLAASYKKMYKAYKRIFKRLGLECLVIDADSGAMGGSGSQEFTIPSEIGETVMARCETCGYAASEERACIGFPKTQITEEIYTVEKILTPNVHTIDELAAFLGLSPENMAKTMIYKADDAYVAAMVRGDREINENKLKNYLGCEVLELADEEAVKFITNAEVGFAGPIGLKVRILADQELEQCRNLVTGANETDYHLRNVNPKRDFQAEYMDLRKVTEGDACPECGSPVILTRGIEVGHIFKLGTKYSEAMGCIFQDEEGKDHPMFMGSYGIGINRTMAGIIEQHYDEDGIIWPMAVAPFQVVIVPVSTDEKQMEITEYLYNTLKVNGADVLMDDRRERAGVKFKDADLIGIPIRINVGRRAKEGLVELKYRDSSHAEELGVAECVEKVLNSINRSYINDDV